MDQADFDYGDWEKASFMKPSVDWLHGKLWIPHESVFLEAKNAELDEAFHNWITRWIRVLEAKEAYVEAQKEKALEELKSLMISRKVTKFHHEEFQALVAEVGRYLEKPTSFLIFEEMAQDFFPSNIYDLVLKRKQLLFCMSIYANLPKDQRLVNYKPEKANVLKIRDKFGFTDKKMAHIFGEAYHLLYRFSYCLTILCPEIQKNKFHHHAQDIYLGWYDDLEGQDSWDANLEFEADEKGKLGGNVYAIIRKGASLVSDLCPLR